MPSDTPGMRGRAIVSLLPALVLLGGCNADGVRPEPGFAPPPPQAAASAVPREADGAIFHAGASYVALHEGLRARAVGDLVTVVLVENVQASKSTASQTDRDGSASITPPSAGPLDFLNPEALKAAAESSFKGTGKASQKSSLNGAIAVTISEVYPNGTAKIVGEKHMALSQGREWIQFSGIVRLSDIDADNRVRSTQVADARILYSGSGAVQRASKPGWLSRFFASISPF